MELGWPIAFPILVTIMSLHSFRIGVKIKLFFSAAAETSHVLEFLIIQHIEEVKGLMLIHVFT